MARLCQREIGAVEQPATFACTRFAVHPSKPHGYEAWVHEKHAGGNFDSQFASNVHTVHTYLLYYTTTATKQQLLQLKKAARLGHKV